MKVGFIGLGHMGKHMAAAVLRAGHELTIHDIRPEAAEDSLLAGARWADTPQAAAVARSNAGRIRLPPAKSE